MSKRLFEKWIASIPAGPEIWKKSVTCQQNDVDYPGIFQTASKQEIDKKMIREFKQTDIELVLDVWLEASIKAHNFVPDEFWKSKLNDMRDVYIPNSETWVYEQDNQIIGFFSLYQDTLAALFVHPDLQGQGIGKILLSKAKSLRNQLNLTVYSENVSSIEFYKKQGFLIIQEQIDVHTKSKELLMKWEKHGDIQRLCHHIALSARL